MEKPRILVVDDEPKACELLQDFLEAKGYTVVTASSGAEALAVAKETQPSLILLDIRMPGMDGLETLQRIQKLNKAARIIMITAADEEEIAKEAMHRGAYDYITKPIDFGYLEVSILTGLAQTGQMRSGHPGVGDTEEGCQKDGL